MSTPRLRPCQTKADDIRRNEVKMAESSKHRPLPVPGVDLVENCYYLKNLFQSVGRSLTLTTNHWEGVRRTEKMKNPRKLSFILVSIYESQAAPLGNPEDDATFVTGYAGMGHFIVGMGHLIQSL